ncbi:MAG: plastocyanin/azurin family copper-binding protein [Polyangiaceae bacterium]|nr:plastocyanin/azurin family copper-binding protein [Polyangiaceae bacterium]
MRTTLGFLTPHLISFSLCAAVAMTAACDAESGDDLGSGASENSEGSSAPSGGAAASLSPGSGASNTDTTNTGGTSPGAGGLPSTGGSGGSPATGGAEPSGGVSSGTGAAAGDEDSATDEDTASGGENSGGDTDDDAALSVTTRGLNFSPAELSIQVGDTVRFSVSNNHDVKEVSEATYNAEESTPLPNGFSLDFGETKDIVFDTVGTYYYVCTPHADQGMKGKIIVE